ncbi:hypothetical protein RND71_015608 [Anisodus tanguticus]|uniref:DUF4378 domain-containing protein n=1 Tax=Anisodus tanguticus TaxID=243964 RepID=A0AAE1S6L2_9SOLA|nr:hypothetical protein RND71_015608 [Anisodus tanguticus]
MSSSCPSPHARISFECRPKLLKDFLQDDSHSYNKKQQQHVQCNLRVLNKKSSQLLRRNRSSRAASTTKSVIHKVINIVKFLPFASVKSPSILPRSISKKLSRIRRNYKENQNHIKNHEVSVTVKDILRWKSSRDLVEKKSTPLDYTYRCTAATATATTTSTTTSSQRSSWCDSDFTAEDLPYWYGEIIDDQCYGKRNPLEEGVGGSCCMGETRGIKLDPKQYICFDENEQQSPVSVLSSPFREDQGGHLSFWKKCMLMQRIQEFENLAEGNTSFKEENYEEEQAQEMNEIIEEKANKLLSLLKETKNLCKEDFEANLDDQLLLDFFWHELMIQNNVDESEMLIRKAKSWINGEYNGEFEWEIEDKREAYIRDMHRVGKWNNFEEEKQELTLDLEFELFNDLVHEVLADYFCS